jgi:hypothetical protein
MKTTPNGWFNDNIKSMIALIVIVWGLAYFQVCSVRNIKPDPQILIAIVTIVTAIISYFFGSSASSVKKDEILQQKQDKPLVTNASTVNVNEAPTDPTSTTP